MTLDLVRSEDLSSWTMDELGARAKAEHLLCLASAQSALEHAIAVGECLMTARANEPGTWKAWFAAQEFEFSIFVGYRYMRMATYRDQIGDLPTVTAAVQALRGMPRSPIAAGLRQSRHDPYPEEVRKEALRLRADGWSGPKVADLLGVSKSRIYSWENPERYRATARRNLARRTEANRLLKANEQQRAIRKATKKAGADLAEAYSTIRLNLEATERAIAATDEYAHKAKLREAYEYAHKAELRILAVLGVS